MNVWKLEISSEELYDKNNYLKTILEFLNHKSRDRMLLRMLWENFDFYCILMRF